MKSFETRLKSYRLIKLLPYSYGLVMGPSHHKIGGIANSECPYLAMMPFKLLDILELNDCMSAWRYSRVCLARALSPSQYFRSLSLPTVQKQ